MTTFQSIIIQGQNVDEPKLHSVQTVHCTYVISFFHKELPLSQKKYIRKVPNGPNVHHTQPTKTENHGANPPRFENGDSILIDTLTSTPPKPNRERIIAHTAEVKFINNCYTTPVIIQFDSFDSENTVNIPVKHHKLFAEIKIINPSATLNIGEKIIHHLGEFSMDTECTDSFIVITNKKSRFPRFWFNMR